jgi:UDP-2,3-diacylglucosamine pyrophosphatase LpxH
MKIASASDLHLEQYVYDRNFRLFDFDLFNRNNVDVLVLAGDILSSDLIGNEKVFELFKTFSENYEQIFYVMGNHEHYFGDFAKTTNSINEFFKDLQNVKLLDKEAVMFNGYRFFGGTMWTDFDNGNPISLMRAKRALNDYVWIKNSNAPVSFKTYDVDGTPKFHVRSGKLIPEEVYQDHLEFIKRFKEDQEANKDAKYVLITHHSPSYQMCSEIYRGDPINDLYHSNLDNLFHDNPNIKLAFMGHTHGKKRLKINECEIVLNARGYPGEHVSTDYQFEISELPDVYT